MASNSFDKLFRITTWGESHGKAIGVVIDGCPAGIEISDSDINVALAKRAPRRNPYTSQRARPDKAQDTIPVLLFVLLPSYLLCA